MRFPHVRFSMRRLMVAIALGGSEPRRLDGISAMHGMAEDLLDPCGANASRAAVFRRTANQTQDQWEEKYHEWDRNGRVFLSYYQPPPPTPIAARLLAERCAGRQAQFECAARFPWWPVDLKGW